MKTEHRGHAPGANAGLTVAKTPFISFDCPFSRRPGPPAPAGGASRALTARLAAHVFLPSSNKPGSTRHGGISKSQACPCSDVEPSASQALSGGVPLVPGVPSSFLPALPFVPPRRWSCEPGLQWEAPHPPPPASPLPRGERYLRARQADLQRSGHGLSGPPGGLCCQPPALTCDFRISLHPDKPAGAVSAAVPPQQRPHPGTGCPNCQRCFPAGLARPRESPA